MGFEKVISVDEIERLGFTLANVRSAKKSNYKISSKGVYGRLKASATAL